MRNNNAITTSSTRERLGAGAAGGAALGAVVGLVSMVGPVIGTAAGAGLGLLIGWAAGSLIREQKTPHPPDPESGQ